MEYSLAAKRRAVLGRATKTLRREQIIPAVLYGHGIPAQSLQVAGRAFERVYAAAKESSLVDLTVEGESPVKVLIQSVQRDPLYGRFRHVDFHQVRMTEKIETEIVLRFDGEPAAVKELGGVLVKSIDAVKVSCLPGDLVQELPVDLTALKTFEDAIHIRDIAVPAGIKILEGAVAVVATVAPPRSEAELAALEQKVETDVEAVEVVGKKKEEAAEGEAAADAAATPKTDEPKAKKE